MIKQISHTITLFFILSYYIFNTHSIYSAINAKDSSQNLAELISTYRFTTSILDLEPLLVSVDSIPSKPAHNLILAHYYIEIGDSEKARIHIKKTIQDLQTTPNDTLLIFAKIIQSTISLKNKDYAQALNNIDETETLIIKKKLKSYLNPLYLLKGLTYKDQEDLEQAIKYVKKGLSISETTPYYKANLLFHKAEIEHLIGATSLAVTSNTKSLHIANTKKYYGLILKCHKLNSLLYKKQGNIEKTEFHIEQSNLLTDSLFQLQRSILFNEKIKQFVSKDNKLTLNQLTEENLQQEKSLKLGRLITYLCIALIIILSLLTFLFFINNRFRAKTNSLLQKKNDELLLAKENADRASEAKIQFLSTITHELRTPLYAVTGITHLLLKEDLTPNQKEHLNTLKFSGEHLLSLINNILDLNKLEANKVEIEKTSFNLQKRINDVLIALNKSAKDKGNTFHYIFDQSIPKRLIGDPMKVSQVLINLIGNAIKFTQNGDIWVRVTQINSTQNKVRLHFEIEDNGLGISNHKQKKIFENFTQGSVQVNRKFGGTGLGLSIVKNLLFLMNSEIQLNSELGKGSLFSFDLNFEVYDTPNTQNNETSQSINYTVMAGKKVLIVEDNKINQLITRKILEKHKIICDVADNGSIAINKVKNMHFDLILMDIHMPGINGIETTKHIRQFNSEIPILALTAVTLSDNLDEFYTNGFDDIIPKPYKTEIFFAKLYKGFTKKQPSSS